MNSAHATAKSRSTRKRKEKPIPLSGIEYQTFGCQSSSLHSALVGILDESQFRDRYLLDSFLSKLGTEAVSEDDRAQRAVDGWIADEQFNAKTTRRLRRLIDDMSWDPVIHGIRVRALLGEAQALILDTIGEWRNEYYGLYARFTNGASVGYNKAMGDPWYKYDGKLTATPLAIQRVVAIVENSPLWRQHLSLRYGCVMNAIKMVPGEIGFTVPKNASTNRFCSKQATGNMLCQTAIGGALRDLLRAVGINLNDQSNNRIAALRASITQLDATLDLKSASNSVVLLLCWLLLPLSWYREIDAVRSPLCQPQAGMAWQRTEMVGAMGNGFTFELETLIFWALAEACRKLTRSRGRTLAYGDDVITPVNCVHHVRALYGFCGFRINADKSFWTGDFRESCGGHYKGGVDVTPIYVRKPINNTSRMLWFLNSLRKWAAIGDICDDRLWPLYRKLRRKYISPTLWGGVRASSISSLWSPGERRRRLHLGIHRRRLVGRPAVIRWMQYASPELQHIIARCEAFGDPQVYYEIFGEVPISASMSYLTTNDDIPLGTMSNKEHRADALPLWAAEISGAL